MAPVLVSLIVILCLLISIVKYTLALILKWSVPGAVVKKDYSYQPTVSVLMPCFNEGRTVYETIESISKSNYPNDKFDHESGAFNDNATDIPTGNTVTLNLTDPDSMTIDPRENIVLDSQADSELVFIRDPLTDEQMVGVLSITTTLTGTDGKPLAITLDDTAFTTHPRAFLLVTDVNGGVIYRPSALRLA
jgi:cellulose synthase/poly-beta-1,6-N-acetylglucosamine synthase-like glycosyltransferase